jgi:hypothetical protein
MSELQNFENKMKIRDIKVGNKVLIKHKKSWQCEFLFCEYEILEIIKDNYKVKDSNNYIYWENLEDSLKNDIYEIFLLNKGNLAYEENLINIIKIKDKEIDDLSDALYNHKHLIENQTGRIIVFEMKEKLQKEIKIDSDIIEEIKDAIETTNQPYTTINIKVLKRLLKQLGIDN